MSTPLDEAEIIAKVLFDEYGSIGVKPYKLPPFIDGKFALKWLKKNNFSHQQVEWPGFFIKHYTRHLLDSHSPGVFEHFKPHRNLRIVKGQYSWDIRLKSIGFKDPWVPTVDKAFLDNYLKQNAGYGLLVALSYAEVDKDGTFLRYQINLKENGGITPYVQKSIAEGRWGKLRKTSFYIIALYGFYITQDDIERGIKENWVDPIYQTTMRQQDGGTRNAKYRFNLEEMITKSCYLKTWNFNESPDDFKEEMSYFDLPKPD